MLQVMLKRNFLKCWKYSLTKVLNVGSIVKKNINIHGINTLPRIPKRLQKIYPLFNFMKHEADEDIKLIDSALTKRNLLMIDGFN